MIRIHATASAVALVTISLFWTLTVVTELALDTAAVTALKTSLPWAFLLLIPALMTAGITGNRLARGRRGGLIGTKLARMKIVAANGALVLLPAAFALAWLAGRGDFGTAFRTIQAVELVAGALNITLLALNLRDGRRLTAGRRRIAHG